MTFTTSSSSGALRDASTTTAPRAASVSETARPSPRPAPGTIATWPRRRVTADTIAKVSVRSALGAGERVRERVGEAIDVVVLVQCPERDAERLQPGLGEMLDDDPLLAPHPLHDLERRRPTRRGHDDARGVARPREHVERKLRETTSTETPARRARSRARRARRR